MRNRSLLFAVATISLAASAHARDVREDPFAYEEREAERQREREEQEAEAPKQSFGNSGDFALSVERLAGYAHTSSLIKVPGPDRKLNLDRIHVLANGSGSPFGFSTPKFAFDFFASRGFSLGAAVGYIKESGGPRFEVITLAPRIGYAIMFGSVVGIWPRLGGTYEIIYTPDAKAWLFAGTFDLPLMLVAGQHVAFNLGPRIDYAFLGEYFPTGAKKSKFTVAEYGFSAGVNLFF
ncbi:MAG TPA: hypothetical protein VIV60_04510 [Polyangiaceae bacterium]